MIPLQFPSSYISVHICKKIIIIIIYSIRCRIIDPLRDIGRGDLDPLNRGGGGMLFNPPFNNPGLGQPGADFRNRLPGMRN